MGAKFPPAGAWGVPQTDLGGWVGSKAVWGHDGIEVVGGHQDLIPWDRPAHWDAA